MRSRYVGEEYIDHAVDGDGDGDDECAWLARHHFQKSLLN